MATNYPAALDTFDNPTGTTPQSVGVGGRTHSQMHADTFDALEAIQSTLGTDPQGSRPTVKERIAAAEAYAVAMAIALG